MAEAYALSNPVEQDCGPELRLLTWEFSSTFVKGRKQLVQQCDMSGWQISKVSLRIWFYPTPNKSTTNVWRLACQRWNNPSGTTVMIAMKKSMDRRKTLLAGLTHLRCCQIAERRRWLLADLLKHWVLVIFDMRPTEAVSWSKPRTESGEHWWKSKKICKILILETSRARDVCWVWFRSCESAGCVEYVKSVQYLFSTDWYFRRFILRRFRLSWERKLKKVLWKNGLGSRELRLFFSVYVSHGWDKVELQTQVEVSANRTWSWRTNVIGRVSVKKKAREEK